MFHLRNIEVVRRRGLQRKRDRFYEDLSPLLEFRDSGDGFLRGRVRYEELIRTVEERGFLCRRMRGTSEVTPLVTKLVKVHGNLDLHHVDGTRRDGDGLGRGKDKILESR